MSKRKRKSHTALDDRPKVEIVQGGNPYPGFKRRTDVVSKFTEPSMTKQSFKDECDVNKIVALFARTGIIKSPHRTPPEFGDAPDATFYESAITQAEIQSHHEAIALAPETSPETPSDAPEDEIPPIGDETLDPPKSDTDNDDSAD